MEKNQTIGEHLRQARESKGLRIEDVAQKTKINLTILRSLEADLYENLPNKTYVRGFVQNYARTLGIDIKESLELLDQSMTPHIEETVDAPEQEIEEKDLEVELKRHEVQEKITNFLHNLFTKKTAIILVVLVVSFFSIKGLVNFFSQLKVEGKLATKVNTPEVVVEAPEAEAAPEIKNADENLFDLKATQKLKEEAVKEEPKVIAKEEAVKEEPKVVIKEVEEKKEEPKPEVKRVIPGGKLPFIKFTQAPRNLYSTLPDAPENKDEALLPTHIRNSMEEGKSNVYVRAVSGDTWISFKVDDEKITRYILKEGRATLLKGDVIQLFMGNLNVAKIFYNNELVETNSRTGVKSLIFPEDKAPEFVFPLFPNYQGVPIEAAEYRERMEEEPSESL